MKLLVNLLATKEIALTDSRRKIKGREGIFRSKLEVIPNGLDIDRFNIPSEKRVKYKNEFKKKYDIPKNAFVFGNVSRLTVEKGHSILLEAFAEFLRFSVLTRDDFYLVLAGGGELAKDLKKQAKELEIDDKVIITGVFEEEDKVKFYSLFDVFVFPSLAEGFGIVLIEAMCMGIPVISSDLPVLKEVGTDTVDFFKTGSHGDLADKMEKTYSTINLSKVKAAKDRVLENYSHAGFVNNYLKLYINLLLQEK